MGSGALEIGPKADPRTITNAIFVFQTASETGAVEDDVIKARQEVQMAEAELENVRSLGRADAVPAAESEPRRRNRIFKPP